MNHPLVSIIVPTLNRYMSLYNCIKSISSQSYTNIEIIIIDDGSSDLTKSAVEKMEDRRIKYIRNQSNLGASASRNKGIRNAKGKYIAFCDDDDQFTKNKILAQTKFMEKHSNYALTYTNAFIRDGDKKYLFSDKLTQNTFSKLLLENSQILTPTVMIRANILNESGLFDEKLNVCEDYDLWLRIASKNTYNFIDKPLSIINKSRVSLTSDASRFFRESVKVKMININKYKDKLPSNIVSKAYSQLYYQKGKYYYFGNNIHLARTNYKKSIYLNPFKVKTYLYFLITYFNKKYFDQYIIPFYELIKKRSYKKNWD